MDTEELPFFRLKALNPFDYGWDSTDSTGRWIYIGEEWDPIYFYGASSHGNPYGKHKASLANAFRAEDKTSFHKLVVCVDTFSGWPWSLLQPRPAAPRHLRGLATLPLSSRPQRQPRLRPPLTPRGCRSP